MPRTLLALVQHVLKAHNWDGILIVASFRIVLEMLDVVYHLVLEILHLLRANDVLDCLHLDLFGLPTALSEGALTNNETSSLELADVEGLLAVKEAKLFVEVDIVILKTVYII